MWGILAQVAIWAGLYIANRLMKPKQAKPKPLTKDNLTLPRTEEGAPAPIVYGTCRVDSPLLIYTSDLFARVVDNSNNGAQYIIYAMDMIFNVGLPMGQGMTTANRLIGPRYLAMWVGDHKVGVQTLPSAQTHDNRYKVVFQPHLLGGAGSGGGLIGVIGFHGGWTDQNLVSPNSRIGDLLEQRLGVGNVPGYRKQMLVSLTGGINSTTYATQTANDGGSGSHDPIPMPVAGFVIGESASVDSMSFEIQARGDALFAGGWVGSGLATMTKFGIDADPIEVIYDVLTNKWGRAGYDTAKIDLASFQTASDTLKDEGHGYSRVIYETQDASAVVGDVLRQIDCAFYEEPTTGLITLKLIRADYDPLTIPAFDEDNIISVDDYGLGTWKDTVNEVRCTFTDREADYKPGVAVAQSLANAFGNANRRKPATVEYIGCSNATLAKKLAARDLNTLAQPLSKIRLTVNRDGHRLRPGSVFKVTWSKYNLQGAIFRCQRVDQGQLFSNKVTLDAVQDAFASTYVGMGQDWATSTSRIPYPFISPHITEAPLWLTSRAQVAGLVTGTDNSYLMPLVQATTNAIKYKLLAHKPSTEFQANTILYFWQTEIPPRAFPTTFRVRTAYDRVNEPYDTSVGLQIDTLIKDSGVLQLSFADVVINPLPSATENDIRLFGKNLVCLVTPSGEEEYIAFESATDNTGGNYTLNNVWRGLLDTPAIDIPVGTIGYFVEPDMISRHGWEANLDIDGYSINTWLVPQGYFTVGSGDDLTLNVPLKARPLMPYPGADIGVNAPVCRGTLGIPSSTNRNKRVTFAEQALELFFTKRDRLSWQITRGNDADQTSNDFSVVADGPVVKANVNDLTATNMAYQVTPNNGTWNTTTPVGGMGGIKVDGYGDLEIGYLTQRTILSQDPSIGGSGVVLGTIYENYKRPAIDITLPSWRDIIANGRFDYRDLSAVDGWSVQSGSIFYQTGTTSLQRAASGNGSHYIEGASASNGRYQDTPITFWKPRGYTAVISAYIRNTVADADDTCQLFLDDLDNASSILSTTSGTATAGATTSWKRITHSHVMVASTASIRSRWFMTNVAAGGDANANVAISDVTTRIGTFQIDVLANPSFETGASTSWTVTAGTWQQSTTVASPSATYVISNAAPSSQYQEYTLPAGWEVGSVAFLEFYRAQHNSLGTGTVKIEAMDGSSNVLASDTTPAETMPASNQWYKRILFCNIPDGSTKIRVTMSSTAVSQAFDEMSLWISKILAPSYIKQLTFDTPTIQYAPTKWQDHARAYPTISVPRWIFTGLDADGASVEQHGTDLVTGSGVLEWTDGTARAAGKLHGQFGNGVTELACYNFTRATGASAPHLAAFGAYRTKVASFSSAQSFTAIAFVRVDEPGFATACGIVGRMDLSNGWGIELTAAGEVQARLRGSSGTKTATTGRSIADRALHMVAIVYDASLQSLTAYDEQGASGATSTAVGLGEIFEESTTNHLRLGRNADDFATLPGQIARVMIWQQALSSAEIAAHWTYAKDPNNLITTYTRTAAAVAAITPDTLGAKLCYFSPTQIALPYSPNLIADGGTGLGLAVGRASTNLIQSWDFEDATKWVPDASATLTQDITDNTGLPRGVQVSGNTTNGITAYLIPAGLAAITLSTSVWLRSISGSLTLDMVLRSSAGVEIQRQTLTLTTQWQRFDRSWSWTGVTATCRFQFVSTASTIVFQASHVTYCGNIAAAGSAYFPVMIPFANTTHGDYNAECATTLPIQFNREGELIAEGTASLDTTSFAAGDVDGTLIDVKNGTNDKNRRRLSWRASSGVMRFSHYDGAAVAVDSDKSYNPSTKIWKARGRWNSVGLVDVTAGRFAQVAVGDNIAPTPAEGGAGRTAIWTHDATQSTKIQIGTGSSAPEDVILRRITVQAREAKFD
jgi:hypothetical protein